MKLKKEDFNKSIQPDGSTLYAYKVKDDFFYLRVQGMGDARNIFVYKNDQFEKDLQNVFSTPDSLAAWNKFEDLIDETSDKQNSSGGFMNNPQSNPKLIPLLAIVENPDNFNMTLFVLMEDGVQHVIKDFVIPKDKFELPANFTSVMFTADFSEVDIIPFLQCEITFKWYQDVVFEQNKDALVFLFIPTSIIEQGGQNGGTDKPSKDITKTAKPKSEQKQDGKPEYEDDDDEKGGEGEPVDGEPVPDDGKEKPKKKGETKGKGKATDEPVDDEDNPENDDNDDNNGDDAKPTDNEGRTDDSEPKKNTGEPKDGDKNGLGSLSGVNQIKDDIVVNLGTSLNMQPETVLSFFRRPKAGETFLLSNNFEKIKKDLNLPSTVTALELSEKIIQLNNN